MGDKLLDARVRAVDMRTPTRGPRPWLLVSPITSGLANRSRYFWIRSRNHTTP